MITVRLYGRCANQLWQIAACIATALRNNTDFNIPDRTVDPKIWKAYFFHFPRRIKMGGRIWREPTHAYTPIPKDKHLILDGYFQSEKYFIDFKKEVFAHLPFSWTEIEGVAIHVRRGDYLTLQDKHPVMSLDYLNGAIRYFWDLGQRKFTFFSDDIAWCKEHFKGEMYGFSEGKTEKQDIELISCHQHQVLSASSFSAWGAMLNRNPDKIVIAPDKWFGDGNAHLPTHDMYCEGWLKMNQKGEFA